MENNISDSLNNDSEIKSVCDNDSLFAEIDRLFSDFIVYFISEIESSLLG